MVCPNERNLAIIMPPYDMIYCNVKAIVDLVPEAVKMAGTVVKVK